MTEFKKQITKDEINELPLFEYKDEIVVINTKEQLLEAIKALAVEKCLG